MTGTQTPNARRENLGSDDARLAGTRVQRLRSSEAPFTPAAGSSPQEGASDIYERVRGALCPFHGLAGEDALDLYAANITTTLLWFQGRLGDQL